MSNDVLSEKDALSLAIGVRKGVLVGKPTHPVEVERLCCFIIKRNARPFPAEVEKMKRRIRASLWTSLGADLIDLIERLAARVPEQRIAELEQQNAELVAALELCKKHMAGDKWDSLFIDGVLSKVKQP